MAGINRLGKGPAKPGTMRPADPNKYKTMDIFSEGTEGDKDYARMVQDIEDTQQNHSGWLFGRGAFDKGDLLYLRDEEEKRRFAEQELRESELRSFARMKQKTEALQEDDAVEDVSAVRQRDGRSQADIVKGLLKVKAAPKVKIKQEVAMEPDTKRLKMEAGTAVKAEPRIKQEAVDTERAQNERDDDDGGTNIFGLLGDYGSDSEEATVPREGKNTIKKAALPLPEMFTKTESTAQAPVQVKKEEPPPWNKGNGKALDSASESSDDTAG